MTDTPTVLEDACSYIYVLLSPPNGWGGHVCKKTGYVSHWMLHLGNERHGEINFQDAIDFVFKTLKEVNMT